MPAAVVAYASDQDLGARHGRIIILDAHWWEPFERVRQLATHSKVATFGLYFAQDRKPTIGRVALNTDTLLVDTMAMLGHPMFSRTSARVQRWLRQLDVDDLRPLINIVNETIGRRTCLVAQSTGVLFGSLDAETSPRLWLIPRLTNARSVEEEDRCTGFNRGNRKAWRHLWTDNTLRTAAANTERRPHDPGSARGKPASGGKSPRR